MRYSGFVLAIGLSMATTSAYGNDDEPAALTLRTAFEPNANADSCFPVDIVEISGRHNLVDQQSLVKVVSPFLVRCQSNETVGEILKAINGLFAQQGYVTTQGYLPPQDIATTQRLLVKIVPGRIGNIRYDEQRGDGSWFLPRLFSKSKQVTQARNMGDLYSRSVELLDSLDDDLEAAVLLPPSARMWAANSAVPGKILHVDDVQDVVDGFNRVSSGKAKAELSPGKEPATSDVKIVNKPEDSFRMYAGYDTESIEGTGRLRFGTTVEKDNLIGLNDTWGLTLRSGKSTNDLSGNVSVPYRSFTFRTSGSWQESTTDLSGLAELFVTTWNVTSGFDWQILRTKTLKSVLDFTINHREQNRYINGLVLQDQRVSTISVGLLQSRSFEKGSLSSRVGLVAGVPIFNASRDPEESARDVPRAQFLKLEGSVSGSYVFPGVASLSTLWAGQLTPHALYKDDQITMGSSSTVRGYANGALAVDSGIYTRNEIAFAIPKFLASPFEKTWIAEDLNRLNPYLFFDAGAGQDNANNAFGYRASSGIGLRYGGPRSSFNAGYAFRLLDDKRSRLDSSQGELFVNFRLKLL